eukprot:6185918-Pleurochrysis_carterae.AAC.2
MTGPCLLFAVFDCANLFMGMPQMGAFARGAERPRRSMEPTNKASKLHAFLTLKPYGSRAARCALAVFTDGASTGRARVETPATSALDTRTALVYTGPGQAKKSLWNSWNALKAFEPPRPK